jgi:hypothetical protein
MDLIYHTVAYEIIGYRGHETMFFDFLLLCKSFLESKWEVPFYQLFSFLQKIETGILKHCPDVLSEKNHEISTF